MAAHRASNQNTPRVSALSVVVLLTLLASLLTPASAHAATFQVTANRIDDPDSGADDGEDTDPVPDGCAPIDCSLREAVIAANAAAGADVITFAELGTIILHQAPFVTLEGEALFDDTAIWDLDVTDPLTIQGMGGDPLEGGRIITDFPSISTESRIFDTTSELSLINVTAAEARVKGDGGIVRARSFTAAADLTITQSSLGGSAASQSGGVIGLARCIAHGDRFHLGAGHR